MTCGKLSINSISAYIAGDLAGQDAQQVQAHLGTCDICRELADNLQKSLHALQILQMEPSEDRFRRMRVRVLQEIAVPRRSPVHSFHWPFGVGWSPALLAATVSLIFVVSTVWLLRPVARGPRLERASVEIEASPANEAPPKTVAGGSQREPVWTDPATGLMWARADNGSDLNWNTATSYCENLRLAGYSDWRLAEIGELIGVYDPSSNVGGSNAANGQPYYIRGGIVLSNRVTWSASTSGPNDAWMFNFHSGTAFAGPRDIAYFKRALCVRSVGKRNGS
jgi:hypothetical protein